MSRPGDTLDPARVAPAPRPRIGFSWTFASHVVGGGAELVLVQALRAIEPDGRLRVEVRSPANPAAPPLTQWLDAHMNRLSREFAPGEAVHYSPAFPMFSFPMRVGDRWKATVRQWQDDPGAASLIEVEARVPGWEVVETPAGRFEALRIEALHRTSEQRVENTYWYAPRAMRAVQGHERTSGLGGSTELRYRLTALDLSS